MHFRSSALSASEVGALIVASATETMFAPMVSTAGAATASITPLDGISATEEYGLEVPPFVGTTEGDWVPAASVIVSLYTTKRGRSYRGRIFLPFIGEAAISDGILETPSPPTLNDAWVDFLSAMLAGGAPIVVASYKLAVATNVNATITQSFLGTQRRRQTRLRFP